MEAIDIVILLVQLATPFAVLYITYRNNKHEKQQKKAQETERELAETKRKEINSTMEDAIQSLEEARSNIENLSETLAAYAKDNDDLKKALTHITTLNRLNGKYTHELAQLVMVLAEGLRDQHLDGNITKAIAKYRDFETNALGAFVTGDDKI